MSLIVRQPAAAGTSSLVAKQAAKAAAAKASPRGNGANAAGRPGKRAITGARRIVNRELSPFSRQLSSMLHAGMSLIVSLTTLEEQAAKALQISLATLYRKLPDGEESPPAGDKRKPDA